jgi:hypothetical protein
MSIEQLQVTLENLKLLKSLEFRVCGCDTALFFENFEIYEEKYKEQAYKIGKLIAENYDRLQHLKLDFDDELISFWILLYLGNNDYIRH